MCIVLSSKKIWAHGEEAGGKTKWKQGNDTVTAIDVLGGCFPLTGFPPYVMPDQCHQLTMFPSHIYVASHAFNPFHLQYSPLSSSKSTFFCSMYNPPVADFPCRMGPRMQVAVEGTPNRRFLDRSSCVQAEHVRSRDASLVVRMILDVGIDVVIVPGR